MYPRIIIPPKDKSFFLFGPRGTGKTAWIKETFGQRCVYLDLLEAETFNLLLANPGRLKTFIPDIFKDWVVIDEVQKIPELLDEVHRLIEAYGFKFVLTGSSARKLKQKGVNLLAGRALTYYLFPLTAIELGNDFSLSHSLKYGTLPSVYTEENVKGYLSSYVKTYLKEEVQQEGLTRNISAFSRFLEAASFSQGCVLNISAVASDCHIERKVVENYFTILEDLLIAKRIPVFTKKAKREITAHPKFYFFDTGVYRTLRPSGPLDEPESIEGVALETLVYQELAAINSYRNFDYGLYYWRTRSGLEVDFVLYGEKGIKVFEVKRSARLRPGDFTSLKEFLKDYPMAKAYLLYGGSKKFVDDGIEVLPIETTFQNLEALL